MISSAPASSTAFDGSFFKGRFYARQPEAMIDVGNDREFGFLYQPERQRAGIRLQPAARRPICRPSRGSRRSSSPASSRCSSTRKTPPSRRPCSQRLSDPDPEVREAARRVVSDEPRSQRGRGRPAADRTCFKSGSKARPRAAKPCLQAIGRNNRLAANPEILGTIRKLIGQPEAAPSLLPVLKWPALADAEVLALLDQAWPRLSQPQRLEAIEVLLGRPALLDRSEPRNPHSTCCAAA